MKYQIYLMVKSMSQETLTIKDQLMERILKAREVVGPDWKKKIMKVDPFYDSYDGARIIDHLSISMSTSKCRIGVDRLLRATKAMEKAAGIEHAPIY